MSHRRERERIYTKVERNENTNFTVAASECAERDENVKDREVVCESSEWRNRKTETVRERQGCTEEKEVDCVIERMRQRRSGNNTANEKSHFL